MVYLCWKGETETWLFPIAHMLQRGSHSSDKNWVERVINRFISARPGGRAGRNPLEKDIGNKIWSWRRGLVDEVLAASRKIWAPVPALKERARCCGNGVPIISQLGRQSQEAHSQLQLAFRIGQLPAYNTYPRTKSSHYGSKKHNHKWKLSKN